ncbi:hypothetical protein [Devosia sp.]|uniref:hypothetical protein n=1 Tax=Devosia sp. TaxID=1871048 RepID=UPI001AD54EEB|nr:hypothetical protein [Devosia sp.]MBN9335789.1 hypothetical protein [Devosia sp.]
MGEALKEWKAVCKRSDQESRRAARRLDGFFPRFADKGTAGFTEEQFKSLGRFRAEGGNEHLLYEFKSHQFRLYGVVRTYKGKRSFVGVACDPAKKTNKADPKVLKRAANAADMIEWEK